MTNKVKKVKQLTKRSIDVTMHPDHWRSQTEEATFLLSDGTKAKFRRVRTGYTFKYYNEVRSTYEDSTEMRWYGWSNWTPLYTSGSKGIREVREACGAPPLRYKPAYYNDQSAPIKATEREARKQDIETLRTRLAMFAMLCPTKSRKGNMFFRVTKKVLEEKESKLEKKNVRMGKQSRSKA